MKKILTIGIATIVLAAFATQVYGQTATPTPTPTPTTTVTNTPTPTTTQTLTPTPTTKVPSGAPSTGLY